jgi:hypothetical protein
MLYNKQIININPHTHVWQVQYGNPTVPPTKDNTIYVNCVGKATAQITAGQLGYPRIFIATPTARNTLTPDTIIHEGIAI